MTRDIVAAINWAWRDAHLLVCCTLDGVLAERGEHPGDIRVPASRRALLGTLASLDCASVCILSGRRLAQVQATVGRDRRQYYVGLRGLEIEGPRLSYFHLGAARTADVLTPLAAALQAVAREAPGLVIEYRNLYLAIRLGWITHPQARETVAKRVRDLAAPFIKTHRLRLVETGTDFEVLPDVRWTAGDAVREIALATERHYGKTAVVVMGSATGDEETFEAVRERGIAVRVGGESGLAAYRAANGDEVESILLGLVRIGSGKLSSDALIAL